MNAVPLVHTGVCCRKLYNFPLGMPEKIKKYLKSIPPQNCVFSNLYIYKKCNKNLNINIKISLVKVSVFLDFAFSICLSIKYYRLYYNKLQA